MVLVLVLVFQTNNMPPPIMNNPRIMMMGKVRKCCFHRQSSCSSSTNDLRRRRTSTSSVTRQHTFGGSERNEGIVVTKRDDWSIRFDAPYHELPHGRLPHCILASIHGPRSIYGWHSVLKP